jgi:hypothetical protein
MPPARRFRHTGSRPPIRGRAPPATRFTFCGRHTGDLFGIAPTGKAFTVTGIDIHRIEGGRIVEEWTSWDVFGLMQQLGALPPGMSGGA